MKLYQTHKVAGTNRKVCAIRLDGEYWNDNLRTVKVWSGEDGKAYELRTIHGEKVFTPFRMCA